jgi:N6-adenosine-specific RNA methylase IME4
MMIYTDFADIPRGGFSTILADPPWHFKSWSDKGRDRSPDAMVKRHGIVERHYKTMSLDKIMALNVAALCQKDAALFLWAVDCMLPEALNVGTAWGFKFKTVAFTWAKTKLDGGFHTGLGHWTRGNPEMCLLFTRGKPKRQSKGVRQLIVAGRREHSRKPEEARERIEALVPGERIELFARDPRPGWSSWGDQTDRF